MGTSTNAILAFGFDLGEELPEAFQDSDGDGDNFDFDEWLNKKAGAIYPVDHAGIKSPEYQAYSTACKAARAASPVDFITHCSYDYPMYFLAVPGTQTTARRGYPETVGTPDVPPEAVAAMRKFCDEHSIEWQEPSWHIFSLWG